MPETDLHPTVQRFIIDFSRFEYALKRAGYVQPRGSSIDAQVDWPKFDRRNANAFRHEVEEASNDRLAKAVHFLTSDPPMKLVVLEDGGIKKLYWKMAVPQGSILDKLLVFVRRVRNNLFHGEKPETLLGGSKRGLQLIESSLEIISVCISLDATVKRYFEKYAPFLPRLDDYDFERVLSEGC